MEELWDNDMKYKDDVSERGKYNRAKYFYGDSAGSALTDKDNFSKSRCDLVHMLMLSDMCTRATKRGAKDTSQLTPEVRNKITKFLDLIQGMPRHQKFHIGFGDEKLHGVKGFDADAREVWQMYVDRAENILNPAGI